MSDARKFRFVSPGIFLNEVDQSQLPSESEAVGPVIIGRTEKGPGMIPVKVRSFSEFVETFGNPIDGKGGVDDVWRETNKSSPTYGAYAAQAYLRANVGPVTFVRLMGTQHSEADTSTGLAGWETTNTPATDLASNGGAYGLFVWPSASVACSTLTVAALPGVSGALNPGLGRITLNCPDGTQWSATASSQDPFDTDHDATFTYGVLDKAYSASLLASCDEETTTVQAQRIALALNHARTGSIGLGIHKVATPADNTIKVCFKNVITDGVGFSTSATTTFAGGLFTDESTPSASFTTFSPTLSAVTGTLAATFYMDTGAPALSGAALATDAVEGLATVVRCDSSNNFKIRILTSAEAETKNATFSLAEGSSNFIRDVFNTNPQLANDSTRGNIEDSNVSTHYWLGETYERFLVDNSITGSGADSLNAAIFALHSGSSLVGPADKEMAYRDAHTGWFFAQNRSTDTTVYDYDGMEKLFKFVGINGHGEWLQNNVKISIDNIRGSSNDNSPYGTFDVVLRKVVDSDQNQIILERFSACNLDPNSMDYVAAKIGDVYQKWDDAEKRYREYGDYPNKSRYIRAVIGEEVSQRTAAKSVLPFGVFGPPRMKSFHFSSGSTTGQIYLSGSFVRSSGSIPDELLMGNPDRTAGAADKHEAGNFVHCGPATASDFGVVKIVFPGTAVRSTANQDGADALKNAYFGLHTGKSDSSTNADPGYPDYIRALGADVISAGTWSDTFGNTMALGYGGIESLEPQWVFTLDEVIPTTGSNFTGSSPTTGITNATWTSGSMKSVNSWNALDSIGKGAARYQNILDSKINRFTSPMFGGFDGFDIVERDPFRNTRIDDNEAETTNYTYYTIKRAIDMVADPEVLSCNLMTVPGLYNQGLTKHLIDVCQSRADALAVIDLKGGYTPRHESNAAIASRQGDLDAVISNIKDRNLNSSYGCAYYPWVTVRDDINGSFVKVPPSVVAMGVLANTEKAADVWFAPAGFQRGGLSQGAGGLPVLNVETKLTSRNRDDLYDVNINPIASFPSEGIVVFGQKTLQASRSALDRINVRRLLIYVKKGISEIASTTLFQPNVRDTWNGFKSRAENFLSDVKVRFGVDDFKVILDETTTTPDLVDRNIMYAKIFIKPTRAIEFIAIDFIITRSGASFED